MAHASHTITKSSEERNPRAESHAQHPDVPRRVNDIGSRLSRVMRHRDGDDQIEHERAMLDDW